jgi:hypothetical protein
MKKQQIIQKFNICDINEKEGNKILNNNTFFQKLIYIMHNDVFKSFYNEYCKDESDITVVLTYMKLYVEVENMYQNKYNEQIKPAIMVKILHDIFMNPVLRKNALNGQPLLV